MTDINTIYTKVVALGRDIESLVQISKFREFDNLNSVKIDRDDPEQRFLLDEMEKIMFAMLDVQCSIAYLSRPIEEVGVLHKNYAGRYETENGTELVHNTEIEALIYDDDLQCYCWKKTRFVKIGDRYCLYDYASIPLDGLTVRIRKPV